MKIDTNYKLEKAVSVDPTRPSINHILIGKDVSKKTVAGAELPHVAVATNGKIMAIVPVIVESETDLGLVSPKALVQARKIAGKKAEEAQMGLNGNITFPDGSALPRPTEQDAGTYPKWQSVLPTGKVKFTVALDPRLLLALAEAIGCDGVFEKGITLAFEGPEKPIRVTPGLTPGDASARGVLMPMRLG